MHLVNQFTIQRNRAAPFGLCGCQRCYNAFSFGKLCSGEDKNFVHSLDVRRMDNRFTIVTEIARRLAALAQAVQIGYGEIEGRRQCWDTFEFIRGATPGFEDAYIVEIAPQIGIRETRRVRGEYMLSEDDVLDCVDFADAIGVNGWPVEAHVAGDVKFLFAREKRGFNQLPYRMIVPQKIDNLFVAGSSVFPTGGFSNPTMTIVALALRLGDHLARELTGRPSPLSQPARSS